MGRAMHKSIRKSQCVIQRPPSKGTPPPITTQAERTKMATTEKPWNEWYLKAADQGYATVQSRIDFMYQKHEGTTQNKQKAIKWYWKAAEQGDITARDNIDSLYQNSADETGAKVIRVYLVDCLTPLRNGSSRNKK